VLVIYLVLGILYESFTTADDPVGAAVGRRRRLLTLLIFRTELNIYGFVGIIMLVGIVKKNAIMMIDFALEASAPARRAGCHLQGVPAPVPADHDDDMAALFGNLPIALGIGAGADARRALGLAVVGGLLVSHC